MNSSSLGSDGDWPWGVRLDLMDISRSLSQAHHRPVPLPPLIFTPSAAPPVLRPRRPLLRRHRHEEDADTDPSGDLTLIILIIVLTPCFLWLLGAVTILTLTLLTRH